MIKRESNAVELSTPEERIAHSVEVRPPRCKRLRTQSFPGKRPSEKAHQLPKNTATCAVMTVMCELGGNRNTMRLPDIKTGSLIPEVSWRWTSGSDGPPLPPWGRGDGMKAEAGRVSHGLIQTLSQVASHGTRGIAASAAVLFRWHFIGKALLSL